MIKLGAALFAVLFFHPAWGDSLHLNCTPMQPPDLQGDERYFHVDFATPDAVAITVASAASPFESAVANLKARGVSYSDASTYASAVWQDGSGGTAVTSSFVYMGTWWGGHLEFVHDVRTPSLQFAAGETYDLHCKELGSTSRRLSLGPAFLVLEIVSPAYSVTRPARRHIPENDY